MLTSTVIVPRFLSTCSMRSHWPKDSIVSSLRPRPFGESALPTTRTRLPSLCALRMMCSTWWDGWQSTRVSLTAFAYVALYGSNRQHRAHPDVIAQLKLDKVQSATPIQQKRWRQNRDTLLQPTIVHSVKYYVVGFRLLPWDLAKAANGTKRY